MAAQQVFINFTEFMVLKSAEAVQIRPHIEDLFVEKARHTLMSEPLLVNPKFAFVAATDIIVGGQRIFENADQCAEDKDIAKLKKIEKEKLYQMSDRYRNVKDEAILVLRLFTEGELTEQCDGIHMYSDQIETMGKLFSKLVHNPVDFPIVYATVQQLGIIQQTVLDFFTCTALKAKTAVVVLNGNVKHEALKLADDTVISLQTVLDYVIECFRDCLRRNMLPFTLYVMYQESSANFSVGDLSEPLVNVVRASYKASVGVTRIHYKVLLNDSRSAHTCHSQHVNNVVVPANRTNPMFQQNNYTQSAEPMASTASTMPGSASTWSVEQLGFDTTDSVDAS